MRRITSKIGVLICVISVLLTLCLSAPVSIFAEEKFVNVTFICEKDKKVIPDIEWRLYRVGSYDGSKITLEGDFAQYRITFGDYSGTALANAAATLENYVIVEKPQPDAVGVSNENGRVSFNTLKNGTYLAVAKRKKEAEKTTVPAPTLINVDASSVDSLKVYPKFKILMTLDAIEESYEVRKIWENPNNLPLKKTEITLGIYEDGELVETVVLNEENNWEYHWMVYEYADWRVIELDLPEDCSVIYRSDGRYYAVVNTYEPDNDFPKVTTVSGDSSVTTTSTAQQNETETRTTTTKFVVDGGEFDTRTSSTVSSPNSTSTTISGGGSGGGKIPQTGQLWWPVPVLIIMGLGLIAIGAGVKSTGKKKNE